MAKDLVIQYQSAIRASAETIISTFLDENKRAALQQQPALRLEGVPFTRLDQLGLEYLRDRDIFLANRLLFGIPRAKHNEDLFAARSRTVYALPAKYDTKLHSLIYRVNLATLCDAILTSHEPVQYPLTERPMQYPSDCLLTDLAHQLPLAFLDVGSNLVQHWTHNHCVKASIQAFILRLQVSLHLGDAVDWLEEIDSTAAQHEPTNFSKQQWAIVRSVIHEQESGSWEARTMQILRSLNAKFPWTEYLVSVSHLALACAEELGLHEILTMSSTQAHSHSRNADCTPRAYDSASLSLVNSNDAQTRSIPSVLHSKLMHSYPSLPAISLPDPQSSGSRSSESSESAYHTPATNSRGTKLENKDFLGSEKVSKFDVHRLSQASRQTDDTPGFPAPDESSSDKSISSSGSMANSSQSNTHKRKRDQPSKSDGISSSKSPGLHSSKPDSARRPSENHKRRTSNTPSFQPRKPDFRSHFQYLREKALYKVQPGPNSQLKIYQSRSATNPSFSRQCSETPSKANLELARQTDDLSASVHTPENRFLKSLSASEHREVLATQPQVLNEIRTDASDQSYKGNRTSRILNSDSSDEESSEFSSDGFDIYQRLEDLEYAQSHVSNPKYNLSSKSLGTTYKQK